MHLILRLMRPGEMALICAVPAKILFFIYLSQASLYFNIYNYVQNIGDKFQKLGYGMFALGDV